MPSTGAVTAALCHLNKHHYGLFPSLTEKYVNFGGNYVELAIDASLL
jgi:hypothetical protein